MNQILTTNLWLEIQWVDYKLRWKPEDKNGITKLHMPSDEIWLPDIVLSDKLVIELLHRLKSPTTTAIAHLNFQCRWRSSNFNSQRRDRVLQWTGCVEAACHFQVVLLYRYRTFSVGIEESSNDRQMHHFTDTILKLAT